MTSSKSGGFLSISLYFLKLILSTLLFWKKPGLTKFLI
ncbi:putative membrane protein [Acinetobacter sp. 983759]|uniref:Uncharacterized protein n=1 Tax=Acinetobacter radioresistens SK82 TaxID=596318 RepID=A0ABM9YR65_ACIRA|nr:hypothetical protein ACIRA0001_0850 [Acinetobacter radioresistens SK82]EXE15454.1 putative membrane protein [Acinetobacter sp. 983759]EXE58117.1 putative membrane protein [Acinetobacter sp. 1239920]